MPLHSGPYMSPEEPFMAALHNAGHAVGCATTGRRLHTAVTTRRCRGNPLGLKPGSDSFSWAIICWAGPAAEAVAGVRSDTSMSEAAQWIWAQYQEGFPDSPDAGYLVAAADPAVLAVSLAIADANWASLEEIATALTRPSRLRQRESGLSPAQVRALIGSSHGTDIGLTGTPLN